MQFDEARIREVIDRAWNWVIPGVDKVVAVNSMANVFLLDLDGKYWRICPEELLVKVVANDDIEAQKVLADPEYKEDWQLLGLIDEAESEFGKLETGECYALIKPAVIGGEYSTANMKVTSVYEYLESFGEIAFQTKDLKQGENIMIHINEGRIEVCWEN